MEQISNVIDFTERSKDHRILKELKRDIICIKALIKDRVNNHDYLDEYELITIFDFLERKYFKA